MVGGLLIWVFGCFGLFVVMVKMVEMVEMVVAGVVVVVVVVAGVVVVVVVVVVCVAGVLLLNGHCSRRTIVVNEADLGGNLLRFSSLKCVFSRQL